MSRTNAASVRSVRDRVARAQRAYAQRLREAAESLHALVEEGDEEARAVQRAIEAELLHLTYASAPRQSNGNSRTVGRLRGGDRLL